MNETSGNRLRIAMLGLTYPFRGGISHYTTLLFKALEQKHDVCLFSLTRQYPGFLFPGKSQKDYSLPLSARNLPCLDSVNPFSWLATFIKIRRFKPDFILFSWWHPFFAPSFGTVAHLAKSVANIPVCYLCHNVFPHENSAIDRMLLHYAYSSGDSFIVHSSEDYEKISLLYPHTRTYQARHSTYDVFAKENPFTEEEAKAKLGLTGKKVLLFFGFIRKYKGLKYLLQAMEFLEPEQGYHLIVAGEFYEKKDQYRVYLDSLNCVKQLTLVDYYIPNEDIPLYFSAADLVVVPYVSATQSGIIQIAYGFLKPVIATSAGGIPDAVADGVTGYLVPPCNARAVASAVRRYFECKEKEKFRKNIARENKKFSWDQTVMTIEKVGKDIKKCPECKN